MLVDTFLNRIKSRGIIPSSQKLYEDEVFLQMIDDVIAVHIVPLLMSLRQDYFVTTTTTATVANQKYYKIPYRAVGKVLRDIKLYKTSTPTQKIDLSRIALEDEHFYSGETGSSPTMFYFIQDKYALVPTPSTADYTIEEWYFIHPSQLTLSTNAAVVTSFTSTTVTCSSIPSVLSGTPEVDFIDKYSSYPIKAMDKAVTNTTSNTFTFASGVIPSDLVVGDYISLKNTSPVIQLPDIAIKLLDSLTTQRILKNQGDFDGANSLESDINKEMESVKKTLEPRIKGEGTKVINRQSILRSGKILRKRGLFY